MKGVLLAAVLAQATSAAAPYRVEIATRGGFSGRGAGGVIVSSDGSVMLVNRRGGRCQGAPANAEALEKLAAAVRAARPARWKSRYVRPENPKGCCDQLSTSLVLAVGEPGAEKRYSTSWFDDSRSLVARDAAAVERAVNQVWKDQKPCDAAPAKKTGL